MKYFGTGLSEAHHALADALRTRGADWREAFFGVHSALHLRDVYGGEPNETDALFGDLRAEEYAIMPSAKDETIAWAVWHMARLEDVTINLLAAGGAQVFDGEWQRRIGIAVTDTGNALSDAEIVELSAAADISSLLKYRSAVGRRTREIAARLSDADLKRKVSAAGLARILAEGGVTEQPDSVWLLDFWSKKTVAGLLLMPATRDPLMHLNDCARMKLAIRSRGTRNDRE